MAFQMLVEWVGLLDEKWGGERGDHTHGDDDGVNLGIEHAQRHTRVGDDERELANLREGESALDGLLERLSRGEHAHGAKGNHAQDDDGCQQRNGARILNDNLGVDHHAH